MSASTMARTAKFQFTPLREGRRNWNSYERLCTNFNSRPSARGDNRLGKRGFFRAYFNSRPSARGDIQSFGRCTSGHLFQFTPLREGRRPFVLCPSVDLLISIHAPPRGATSPLQLASTSYDFNSRPSARGDNGVGTRFQRLLFQFTPLREGRRQFAEHTGR